MVLTPCAHGLNCIEAYWFPSKLTDEKEIELVNLLLQKHSDKVAMIKQCEPNELAMVKKTKLLQEKNQSQK